MFAQLASPEYAVPRLSRGSRLGYLQEKRFTQRKSDTVFLFVCRYVLPSETEESARTLCVISSLFNDLKITKSPRFFIISFTELLEEHCSHPMLAVYLVLTCSMNIIYLEKVYRFFFNIT